MKRSKLFTVAVLALAVQTVCSQTSMDAPNLSEPTLINPGHFGPNAFPVPDMLDGTVSRDLRIEASASHYWGKRGDNASDLLLRLNIPLFTPRVNLSLWMVPVERWHQSDENLRACRLEENAGRYDHVRNGVATGDVYVSGQWSQGEKSEEYRMEYDDALGVYEKAVLLKQGYYSYEFIQSNGSTARTMGSFYQTENEYQILLYYREQGGRYDRLVGYALVHS